MTGQESKEAESARWRYVLAFVLLIVVGCGAICVLQVWRRGPNSLVADQSTSEKTATAERKWAQRLEVPGVPNFHKVSDELYRGGQPSAAGMQQLQKLGIKTVINLRSFHSDRDEIGDTGLGYEHIYMKAWHPEDKELVRFLQIVTNGDRTPVFVHCQYGSDRTGTVCAIYRVAVQGWSKDEAIEEMTEGGFGFNRLWQNLVDYVLKTDIDEIKHRAGLTR
jgi:protein tyrosine phosphatase (PTP) superfamily phosphohydrolase (DUF442 family)